MTPIALASRTEGLVRLGAAAAILGGVLRVVSSFIPYNADSLALETLYGVIDLSLLFGLLAVYISSAEPIGLAGLGAFVVATAGLSSIVGPDDNAFGIDFYRLGAIVFVVGLAGVSVQLLRNRTLIVSALLWLATLAASLLALVLTQAFAVAGMCLGAGFAIAGIDILRLREARVVAAI